MKANKEDLEQDFVSLSYYLDYASEQIKSDPGGFLKNKYLFDDELVSFLKAYEELMERMDGTDSGEKASPDHST
jgi:hypothetical protein